MIHQLTHIPIFNRSVFFCGNCSADEASDFIYNFEDRRTIITFSENSDAQTAMYGGDVYVWQKNLDCESHWVHEISHMAQDIMEICGIPFCPETSEVHAYLQQYLKVNLIDEVYAQYDKESNKESKK